jgi:hypothetical protein
MIIFDNKYRRPIPAAVSKECATTRQPFRVKSLFIIIAPSLPYMDIIPYEEHPEKQGRKPGHFEIDRL